MTTTPPPGGPTAAGQAPLSAVLEELARRRPVFRSEADLQHSFARLLREPAPEVRSRLEVPRRHNGRVERLDLLCLGSRGRTAIEFTYPTRRWTGTAGTPPEDYALRNHAAMDLARLHFVRDMARLERSRSQPDGNGPAVLLTNAPSLWTPSAPARKRTRDEEMNESDVCPGRPRGPRGLKAGVRRSVSADHGLTTQRVVGTAASPVPVVNFTVRLWAQGRLPPLCTATRAAGRSTASAYAQFGSAPSAARAAGTGQGDRNGTEGGDGRDGAGLHSSIPLKQCDRRTVGKRGRTVISIAHDKFV